MSFTFNPGASVDGIINFDILPNVKLHRMATTKLGYELYDYVPHDLFNFLELLNDQTT